MIIKFEREFLKKLYIIPLDEIRGKLYYPLEVIKQFKKKVLMLIAIPNLKELKFFKSLHFEYLKGNRKGQCSIRLNDQFRLIFVPVIENEIKVLLLKEISKHYE